MVTNKRLIIFGAFMAFALSNLNAEQVEVTTADFFADENKLISDLKGGVHIKKGDFDELTSESGRIYFNKEKQPVKYVATGNVKMKAIVNGKKYDGSGDEATYEPATSTYTLTGKAYLHEIDTDKKVYGNRITVNQKDGTYHVDSADKQPVRMIFQVEDAKK